MKLKPLIAFARTSGSLLTQHPYGRLTKCYILRWSGSRIWEVVSCWDCSSVALGWDSGA